MMKHRHAIAAAAFASPIHVVSRCGHSTSMRWADCGIARRQSSARDRGSLFIADRLGLQRKPPTVQRAADATLAGRFQVSRKFSPPVSALG
jgi:hypothetical protein